MQSGRQAGSKRRLIELIDCLSERARRSYFLKACVNTKELVNLFFQGVYSINAIGSSSSSFQSFQSSLASIYSLIIRPMARGAGRLQVPAIWINYSPLFLARACLLKTYRLEFLQIAATKFLTTICLRASIFSNRNTDRSMF